LSEARLSKAAISTTDERAPGQEALVFFSLLSSLAVRSV